MILSGSECDGERPRSVTLWLLWFLLHKRNNVQHAHAHVFFFSYVPSNLPLSFFHSHTQTHTDWRRIILLLISLLHISRRVVLAPLAVSLSINKALIALSLECDLARLRDVFLWPPTLEDLLGLLQFSSLRRLVSNARCQLSATQAVTHKDDAAGRREKKNLQQPLGGFRHSG